MKKSRTEYAKVKAIKKFGDATSGLTVYDTYIPNNILDSLQEIWEISNKERKEKSGNIEITSIQEGADSYAISYDISKITSNPANEFRGAVMLYPYTEEWLGYMTFHTHPAPQNLAPNVYRTGIITPFSSGDIGVYVAQWPKKQVSSLSQASTPLGVEVRSSSLASTAIEYSFT